MLKIKKKVNKERFCITLDSDIAEFIDTKMKLGYNRSEAINEILRQVREEEKGVLRIKK